MEIFQSQRALSSNPESRESTAGRVPQVASKELKVKSSASVFFRLSRQFSFCFTRNFFLLPVSDGEHATPELDFAILLLSNHQQPPVFQVLDPLLEVSMGGQAVIGKKKKALA